MAGAVLGTRRRGAVVTVTGPDVVVGAQLVGGGLTPGFTGAEDWKIVLTRDARQELLDYLRRDCINKETAQADVDDFIESLKRRRQTARGWFWQFSQRAS